MKKLIAVAAASLAILSAAESAKAGAARRHTLEGVLLGTGAAILGTALIQSMDGTGRHILLNEVVPGRQCRPPRRWKKQGRGHWKHRRTWVPPRYETRWNPGHYNKRGRWVTGRYEKFPVSRGHWKKERGRVRQRPYYRY